MTPAAATLRVAFQTLGCRLNQVDTQELRHRVDAAETARRARVLRGVAAGKNAAFRRDLVGTEAEALVLEAPAGDGEGLVGLTGHYVEVVFAGPPALRRRLARVRIDAVDGARTAGTLGGQQ